MNFAISGFFEPPRLGARLRTRSTGHFDLSPQENIMLSKKLQSLTLVAAVLGASFAYAGPLVSDRGDSSGCPIYMLDGASFELNFTRGLVTVKSPDGKTRAAADGIYTAPDGSKISVKGGKQDFSWGMNGKAMPTDQKALVK
jgi:hypothetical protein